MNCFFYLLTQHQFSSNHIHLHASLLCQFQASREMPFTNFMKLSTANKTEKLISAFEKILCWAQKDSWIFRCCRNMSAVRELYLDLLDMLCNIRCFAISLLEDDEIESRPACYAHEPHMRGLDFLTTDLHLMLSLFLQSLKNGKLNTDQKLDTLFHLSHTVNDLLIVFEKKYG